MKEFKIPVIASFIFAAVNIFFDFLLVKRFKVVGIASANSIALSVEFIIMIAYLLSIKVKIKLWKEFIIPLLKIIAASAVMILIGKFVYFNLSGINIFIAVFHGVFAFLLMLAIASSVYIIMLKLLKFEDVNLIFYLLKKINSRLKKNG